MRKPLFSPFPAKRLRSLSLGFFDKSSPLFSVIANFRFPPLPPESFILSQFPHVPSSPLFFWLGDKCFRIDTRGHPSNASASNQRLPRYSPNRLSNFLPPPFPPPSMGCEMVGVPNSIFTLSEVFSLPNSPLSRLCEEVGFL